MTRYSVIVNFFYVLRVGDFQGIFSEIKNISGFFWWKRWQCPMQEMVLKSSATFFIVLKRGFGYQINKITSICILTYSILIGRRLSTTECHEIFVIILFHESRPFGPLINSLKWFCLKIRFAKIFAKSVTPRRLPLRGVNY